MRRPRGMCWRRDCKPGSHQRSAGRGGGRPVRVGRWCGARRCSRRSSSWTASSASWSAWPARAAARRAPAPASAGPRRTCPPRPHGARPPARPRPAGAPRRWRRARGRLERGAGRLRGGPWGPSSSWARGGGRGRAGGAGGGQRDAGAEAGSSARRSRGRVVSRCPSGRWRQNNTLAAGSLATGASAVGMGGRLLTAMVPPC